MVSTEKQPTWAVVGGGMLGLTLAYRLARRGHRVCLFEAAAELGGLTSAWQLGDVVWDKYYHVILMTDSHLRKLLEEIGLSEQLRWTETKTGFFTDGQLYSMSNTLEFLSFPPLTLFEKVRLGGTIFYASKIKNWKRLEGIGVEPWLRRWSGNGTFEKIWHPLLMAKLGDSYRQTSASFIWAHINRMYQARRSGMKKEMFGYVTGGYRTILHRLQERLRELGVDIWTACPIESIRKNIDGRFTVRTDTGQAEYVDRLIVTAPASVAKRICPDLSPLELEQLDSIEYLGIVCGSMLLKQPLSPYYVTNITDHGIPLTAVIEMSNIVDRSELGGRSLVYLPKYVPAHDPLFEKTDQEIESQFMAALQRMYPHFQPDQVEAFKISRTRWVMAIPTLRYSESLPDQKTSVPGLYLVNSSYILKGNLNVNETIAIADTAIQQCLSPDPGFRQVEPGLVNIT